MSDICNACIALIHGRCRGCPCTEGEHPLRAVRNDIPLENPIRDLEKRKPQKTDEMVARLMSVLGNGIGNIKGSRQIAREIGMPDRWQVGALVNIARERGHVIGSKHASGYWLIETDAEFELTRDTLLVRIGGIRRTLDALTEAWDAKRNNGDDAIT